jgi:hypothetical protein
MIVCVCVVCVCVACMYSVGTTDCGDRVISETRAGGFGSRRPREEAGKHGVVEDEEEEG